MEMNILKLNKMQFSVLDSIKHEAKKFYFTGNFGISVLFLFQYLIQYLRENYPELI